MTRVAAVVLAAGESSRLGEPKQLVHLQNERLLERAVRVAAEGGCEPVVVVLGAASERIVAECALDSASIVVNADWAEGMSSSIRLGIASVAHEADAAIVMTCDQPAVTAGHLRNLIDLCKTVPVASSYAGRRGVPACFPAGCFGELLELSGDAGARALLASAPTVALAGGELDIDTLDALETARSVYR
jgi:CTP:molybdopterin cytidylyltransferase MocA